jgi:uncharacterized repeat protein (TIGR01451 family)
MDIKNPEVQVDLQVEDTTSTKGENSRVKNSDDGILRPSDEVKYTATITNSGTVSANDVVFKDTLIEEDDSFLYSTILSTDGTKEGAFKITPSWSDSTLTTTNASQIVRGKAKVDLTFNSIPAGENIKLEYTVKMGEVLENGESDYSLDNTVYVDAPTQIVEAHPEYDDDASTSLIDGEPSFSVSKSVIDQDGDNVAEPGENLNYIITYKNTSLDTDPNNKVPIQNLAMYDPLTEIKALGGTAPLKSTVTINDIEQNVTGSIDSEGSDPDSNLDNGIILPLLEAGESAEVKFSVKVPDTVNSSFDNEISNTAYGYMDTSIGEE